MRIVAPAPPSRPGLCLLTEAQRGGPQIVAFPRRPQALAGNSAPVTVVHNDGRDLAVLRTSLTSADTVISLLPGGNRHDPHLAAETARTVLTAMNDTGVNRLVVGSAYPIFAYPPRLPIWILRRIL